MDTKKIGQLIKEERIKRGLTGEQLGTIVGVGKAQISKIENGSTNSITPITKVSAALGVTFDVKLSQKKNIDKRVVGYIIACINLFASTFNLTIREATNYLNRYKGIEFLTTHYEVEHLLSLEDTVYDLAMICYNNGGGIK